MLEELGDGELLPCPKCEGAHIAPDQISAKGSRFVRYCDACDWSTATFETPEEAIAAWNTRTTPQGHS